MIGNFRALAKGLKNRQGLEIKKQSIFRSGDLVECDQSETKNIISLGIEKIYDLRSAYEKKPHPLYEEIKTHWFDLNQDSMLSQFNLDMLEQMEDISLKQQMIILYQQVPYTRQFKQAIQDIVKNEKPFLFHCVAGKDRTGMIGAMIMLLLDFSEDAIIKEYLVFDSLIMDKMMQDVKNKYQISDELLKKIKPLMNVDVDYINAFLKSIKDQYQAYNNYIEQFLNISTENINKFKYNYLIGEERESYERE